MAAALVLGDIIKARFWCSTASGGGQAAVNTIGYKVANVGGTGATDQDVADQLNTLAAADYIALLSTNATYDGVQVQICLTGYPFKAKYSSVSNIVGAGPGTVTGNVMPTQTSGLISYQSAFAGQQFRGRSYIPFPGGADNTTTGDPTAGYVMRLTTLAGVLETGLIITPAGGTVTLVRVLLNGPDKGGITPNPSPVVGATPSIRWATQRRRGDFGRQNRSPI